MLHDRPLVVDLITLTLNHGVFAVRAASSIAEAQAILAEWAPNISVVDMDHDDATAVLKLLGASNTLKRSGTPVLGLTRRGDLKTKLRAFDLGVDDILLARRSLAGCGTDGLFEASPTSPPAWR